MNNLQDTMIPQPPRRRFKMPAASLFMITLVTFAALFVMVDKSGIMDFQRVQSRGISEDLHAHREALEKQRLLYEQWRFFKKQEVLRQRYKDIPRNSRLWGALWASLIGGLIGIMLLFGIGLSAGIYKVCSSRGDTLLLALSSLKKTTPEQYKLEIEKVKLLEIQAKMARDPYMLEQNAVHTIDISPRKVDLRASDCLQEGHINRSSPDFFYGNDESGSPVYGNFLKSRSCIAIGGQQQFGKSSDAVNISGQHYHKGWQGIVIDLHSHKDESYTQRMRDFQHSQNILWCGCQNDVDSTLDIALTYLEKRLISETELIPLLLVIDEALFVARHFSKTKELLVRISTEGYKARMFALAIAHTWKGADQNTTTIRDSFKIKLAHNMARKQAYTFLDDKELSQQTGKLERGQAVLLEETGTDHIIQIPKYDMPTINQMASEAISNPLEVISEPGKRTGDVVYLHKEGFLSKIRGW